MLSILTLLLSSFFLISWWDDKPTGPRGGLGDNPGSEPDWPNTLNWPGQYGSGITAEDECICAYVRVGAEATRHVSMRVLVHVHDARR